MKEQRSIPVLPVAVTAVVLLVLALAAYISGYCCLGKKGFAIDDLVFRSYSLPQCTIIFYPVAIAEVTLTGKEVLLHDSTGKGAIREVTEDSLWELPRRVGRLLRKPQGSQRIGQIRSWPFLDPPVKFQR